jgi:DNA transformation protein
MNDAGFVAHCLELLGAAGRARSRRMFGGHGLYVDDVFVAIVVGERLYLKTDPASRPAFAEAGCEPFVYDGGGKAVTLGYWSAPPEAMESPALMLPWARRALQAALAARAAAPVKRRTRKAAASTAAAPADAAPTRRRAPR